MKKVYAIAIPGEDDPITFSAIYHKVYLDRKNAEKQLKAMRSAGFKNYDIIELKVYSAWNDETKISVAYYGYLYIIDEAEDEKRLLVSSDCLFTSRDYLRKWCLTTRCSEYAKVVKCNEAMTNYTFRETLSNGLFQVRIRAVTIV